jgi:protein ImuB
MDRWRITAKRSGKALWGDTPFVLTLEGHHGEVVHAANAPARALGMASDARLVDMRAICPNLRAEPADPRGDHEALKKLVFWARRWCPWSAIDGEDGFVLDTTGADHLLGGETAMLADMEARLAVTGLSVRLAIAPTWGAAWALTRYGRNGHEICGPGEIAVRLAPLPVSSLRLDDKTLLLLRRLGLKTVGMLAVVPRLSLARRFSRSELQANPLLRLDQAMGDMAEPISGPRKAPRFLAVSRLLEPIQDPTPYLPALSEDVCAKLDTEGWGARRLRLRIYRTDGEVRVLDTATSSPNRDADHLVRLFDGKLERLDPGFGFDLLTLEATVAEPLGVAQQRLDEPAQEEVHLSSLIDRLTARFGMGAVTWPRAMESHIPERAQSRATALGSNPDPLACAPHIRPLRLLDPPEPVGVLYAVPEGPPAQFVWRRQVHRIARHQGPERIAPEWWRARSGTRLRDYYCVEDQGGKRFWLYREGLPDDGRGGDPHWYLHGMFA